MNPSREGLAEHIGRQIDAAGGWLPFERFMERALYTPGLGYYARGTPIFGAWPTARGAARGAAHGTARGTAHGSSAGSDFITAPELSPLFGAALAVQLRQALAATGTRELWEFGAGTGALAAQLLDALGSEVERYTIVELSAPLRERQRERLQAHAASATHAERVRWIDALPARFEGVVIGNEVLDAMPVALLHFDGERWFERGVVRAATDAPPGPGGAAAAFAWADRPTARRPPLERGRFVPGATVEVHAQAEGFIRTLAERLERGAAFFIDYGFPEHEYYHPERHGGTLMCHRAHRADTDPLADVGEKDITAHVNWSGIALTAQDAGLHVLGYTSQARFLVNCGLPALMAQADLRAQAAALKLVQEHEMGELFKVLGLAAGAPFDALGFAAGDRSHML